MIRLDAPAIGFRAFSWDGIKQLGATGVERVWPITKDPQVASCVFSSHEAPRETCSCGLYARSVAPARVDYIGPCGVVLGYGNLIIHPDGFRAEKAEVVALVDRVGSLLPPTDPERLKATAEAYGARLVSGWDEALLLAKEQGGEEIPEALYQQAEDNATRPGWFKNARGWEYHDYITRDKEPKPVNFAGLPQFFLDFVEKKPAFYELLAAKRTEAKEMLRSGQGITTQVIITINLELS